MTYTEDLELQIEKLEEVNNKLCNDIGSLEDDIKKSKIVHYIMFSLNVHNKECLYTICESFERCCYECALGIKNHLKNKKSPNVKLNVEITHWAIHSKDLLTNFVKKINIDDQGSVLSSGTSINIEDKISYFNKIYSELIL